MRTEVSNAKVRNDGLLGIRIIEGSEIFLISLGRPWMMNSVLEGLRQRQLDDIH